MTESAQIQHLTAEVARLEREKHKLFVQFAGCSRAIKQLRLENGYLQSERDELQDKIEQLTGKAAA